MAASASGVAFAQGQPAHSERPAARQFEISVAAWSLHKEILSGQLKAKEAFRVVREELDLGAFELVNTLLEVPTARYVASLRQESERHAVKVPLVMCDAEGELGHVDENERRRAVRNHLKWIYVAADLGCAAIRVNWGGASAGTEKDQRLQEELISRSAPSFRALVELAAREGVAVIVENHWGPSSHPEILVRLMRAVDSPHFGTLPDFGNFPADVDRYEAVDKMMPWAKAVSAKCYDFGPDGGETRIDFERMLSICVDRHGYHGYIGVEFEGERLAERDGIRACRDLLLRLKG
jgi:sugar phosphate isomerase/epimerase